jgi:hypothetical protein
MFFINDYAKNHKDKIEQIISIFNQYTQDINEKILKFYFRNDSRIILVFDKDKLIGFYLYAPAKLFFSIPSNLKYKLNTIDKINIDVNKCCVAIFALIDKRYDESLYLEMFDHRRKDAIQQGYIYSIANINTTYTDVDYCKMNEWSKNIDMFTEKFNTSYIITDYKNVRNEPIIIHKYV